MKTSNTAKVLVVANQKGGEAKTTTAHAIGSGLQLRGYKVLFVDLDGQCNLSYTLKALDCEKTALNIFKDKEAIENIVLKTDTVDIIPGSPFLNGVDSDPIKPGFNKVFKEALDPIKELYDFIVIDTPPALGVRTVNALTAADYLVIPAQADVYSLQGIGQLYSTVNTVRQNGNPNLRIGGIVLTRYSRTILNKSLYELIKETAANIETKVFDTVVREAIAVKEAKANLQSVLEYAPQSNVAGDYNRLIDEIVNDL